MTLAHPGGLPPNSLLDDQLVANTSIPLPPAVLSPGANAGLWALRVFTLTLAVLVVSVFVLNLV